MLTSFLHLCCTTFQSCCNDKKDTFYATVTSPNQSTVKELFPYKKKIIFLKKSV